MPGMSTLVCGSSARLPSTISSTVATARRAAWTMSLASRSPLAVTLPKRSPRKPWKTATSGAREGRMAISPRGAEGGREAMLHEGEARELHGGQRPGADHEVGHDACARRQHEVQVAASLPQQLVEEGHRLVLHVADVDDLVAVAHEARRLAHARDHAAHRVPLACGPAGVNRKSSCRER